MEDKDRTLDEVVTDFDKMLAEFDNRVQRLRDRFKKIYDLFYTIEDQIWEYGAKIDDLQECLMKYRFKQ